MQQNNDPSALPKVQSLVTLAPVSAGQVTKLIFTNNTGIGNHAVTSNIASVGGQSILLASPTKTISIPKNVVASQHILKPMPGTPTKQTVYVLPPMKTTQKMTNMSATLKSPIRIAPATSVPFPTLQTSKVVSAPNSTFPKTISIQQSPKKIIVKPFMSSANTGASSSSNFTSMLNPLSMSSVVQVSSSSVSSHQVQLTSSKLHYVRLVSAAGSSATTVTTKQTASPISVPSVSTVTTNATSSVTAANTPIRLSLPLTSVVSGQKQIIPLKAVQKIPGTSIAQIRPHGQVSTGQLSQMSPGTLIPIGNTGQNYVVLPANYITQMQSSSVQGTNQAAHVVIQNLNIVPPATPVANTASENEPRNILPAGTTVSSAETINRTSFIPIAPSGSNAPYSPAQPSSPLSTPSSRFINGRLPFSSCDSRPRKPCNCTKSQCLKLYCECFANGEFCNSCNCNNCYNNLEHEIERQKAIKACLDRNPMAFHPKIGKSQGTDKERRHTKGCNCRRSGCLKNYCECYEAKILCTNLCRCIGCKNFEDSSEKKTLFHLADAAEVRVQQAAATASLSSNMLRLPVKHLGGARGSNLPSSYVTDEVIHMTIECLMARANAAEAENSSQAETEHLVLEEFGQCLRKLIEFSNQAAESDSESELNS